MASVRARGRAVRGACERSERPTVACGGRYSESGEGLRPGIDWSRGFWCRGSESSASPAVQGTRCIAAPGSPRRQRPLRPCPVPGKRLGPEPTECGCGATTGTRQPITEGGRRR